MKRIFFMFLALLLCVMVQVHIPKHTRSLSGSLLGYKTIP